MSSPFPSLSLSTVLHYLPLMGLIRNEAKENENAAACLLAYITFTRKRDEKWAFRAQKSRQDVYISISTARKQLKFGVVTVADI